MPPFPKPKFQYTYDVSAEIDHLRQHKLTRGVPAKAQDRLLIATWNIANFGVQERTGDDRELIAEVIGWFDAFAVQETQGKYAGFDRNPYFAYEKPRCARRLQHAEG